MVKVEVLVTGDLHLGKKFHFGRRSKNEARREDLLKRFKEIVDYALENEPDLFIITGDNFEKITPLNDPEHFFYNLIGRLKKKGIEPVVIAGNHEVPKSGRSRTVAIDKLSIIDQATVLSNWERIESKTFNIKGKEICVAGRSYCPRRSENPLGDEEVPKSGDINILVLHASFHGLSVDTPRTKFSDANPFHTSDIEKGIDLLALGHYHNVFSREHGGTLIVNPGSIEKLDFKEEKDDKGFYWVEIDENRVEEKFISLDTRPMETVSFKLSEEMDNVNREILDFLKEKENSEKILRLVLEGKITVNQYRMLDVRRIKEETDDMFFYLKVKRDELKVEEYGKIFVGELDDPTEAFKKQVIKNINQAEGEEKEVYEMVKELGLKYLEGERHEN